MQMASGGDSARRSSLRLPGADIEAMMNGATDLLEQAENLLDTRQLDAALGTFNEAELRGASADRCAAGRWMVWMLVGHFENAWRESDAIRTRAAPDPHRFWNGEGIAEKNVVLRCLHGFGDAVQMLRFAPRLARCCSALILEVPPRMLELASCFEGVDRVITWGALAPAAAPAWDVQIEVMELPYLFRTTQHDLPAATNYLHVPSAVRSHVLGVMGPRRRPRVGLVWAAGDWNPSRSVPLQHIAHLLETSGCEFWNLQGGKEQTEWRNLRAAAAHRDAAECGDGILTLAAVIEQLDLVITVDTLAAHLAGALGRPAWVMLQHAADWRWMVNRCDSPWYPALKLYRQREPGDWDSVTKDVKRDLARWVRQQQPMEKAS